MLVVVVLLATVLLRVAIVTAVVYLLLPQGSLCPHCNLEMVAVRNRVLDQLVPVLQRRWCLECGWNGVVRRVRRGPHGSRPKKTRHRRGCKTETLHRDNGGPLWPPTAPRPVAATAPPAPPPLR